MNQWLKKRPESVGDWLLLIAAGAAVFTALRNLGVIGAAAGKLLGILAPFAGALLVAYLVDLLARFYTKRLFGGRRGPAIFASYLTFVLVIVLLVSLVVPQLQASIRMFAGNLPTYMENTEALITTLQEQFGLNLTVASNALQSSGQIMQKIGDFIMQRAPELASMAVGAAGNVVTVFTAIAGSIYMLAGKDKLLHGLRSFVNALLPRGAAQGILDTFHMANKTFSGYITGQMIDALLVGIETFVMMSVLGLNFAPLISVLVGVTNIIPIFGPFIGAVPGALILLLANPIQAVEFVVLILVIQQVDGNFIAPRIVGDAIGISGLWVLFAIIVGGDLFGLPGMVIGVPVFAVLYTLFGRFVRAGLAKKGIDGEGHALTAAPVTEDKPGQNS